jgi:hypothetical protein
MAQAFFFPLQQKLLLGCLLDVKRQREKRDFGSKEKATTKALEYT